MEVAIIRPGPIQGNAVHPYLRRKQGIEPVTYLHPSLEPILRETLGVILYQEQVMRIAIDVAGFTPAESDGFRRAMGTWRSSPEMEKLHARFVDGCMRQPGMTAEEAEELFRQVAAFASFGFAKSHAAAFARTAYESAFLKLFYPAQFLVGLINAQPMGFYPVEVLVNDAKRHGVAVLPVDINASALQDHDRMGGPAGGGGGMRASRSPTARGSTGGPSRSARRPASSRRRRRASAGRGGRRPAGASGWACTWSRGSARSTRRCWTRSWRAGRTQSLADVVARTGLPEEVLERLIRAGALDSLGRPRRELLWQLREVAGASSGRVDGRTVAGRAAGAGGPAGGRWTCGCRPRPPRRCRRSPSWSGSATPTRCWALDARRQVVELFRPALDRLGAVTNAALAERGRDRSGSAGWW